MNSFIVVTSVFNFHHHKRNSNTIQFICYLFCLQNSSKGKSSNVPPPVALNKSKFSGPASLIRKEKRQGSSLFNITKNRELLKLPLIKGESIIMYFFPVLWSSILELSAFLPLLLPEVLSIDFCAPLISQLSAFFKNLTVMRHKE